MMQKVEVLKTIPELVCLYFSEEQFTLSPGSDRIDFFVILKYNISGMLATWYY